MTQILYGLIGIGILAFILGIILAPQKAFYNFLVQYFFFTCLGLAGIFFIALHYLTNSTWSTVIKRIPEGMASFLLPAAMGSVIIFIGASRLYSWLSGDLHVQPAKQVYLSLPWFIARIALFLLIWFIFSRIIIKNSTTQAGAEDKKPAAANTRLSAAFMIIFALTFTLFSFDLLMSLKPDWYSTMFGVYCFAGLFQSGLALIAILTIAAHRGGAFGNTLHEAHLKDLGTLLFAFTIFWGYIGFAQFMLIWYANLPEEISFFMMRMHHGWQWLTLALPFLKFVIPFFMILSQPAKKNQNIMLAASALIIIGQWLDIYWLVVPNFSESPYFPGWIEFGVAAGFVGVFGLSLLSFFKKHSLVPIGDPKVWASANWRQ